MAESFVRSPQQSFSIEKRIALAAVTHDLYGTRTRRSIRSRGLDASLRGYTPKLYWARELSPRLALTPCRLARAAENLLEEPANRDDNATQKW